ncbi:hypothetical protein, partial [Streptomyces prunicolor]|uniref:hypothetical protein n=1 Tax=Streptomyces prunicolor TaxID=67348 RepID=UPI0033E30CC9
SVPSPAPLPARAAVERRFTGTTSAPPHELLAAFASFSGLSTEPHGTRSAAPHSTGSTAPHSTGSTEPHGTEPAPADDTEAQPAPYERLLAAPALTEDDLRDNFGVEATAPELIRLRRRDGTERLPAFQFDGTGRPREVVVAVNRMLGAAEDPWGWPTGGSAPTPGWPRPRRHCSARVWTDNCSPRRAWWARRTDMARGARLPDRGTAEPKRIDWQAGQVLYRVHSQHRKAAEFNPRPAAQGT